MLIERHDINDIQFSRLGEGAVFLYDDVPYMKIREIDKYDEILDRTFIYNAVCLGNGTLDCIDDIQHVYARPDSYVVIK